MTVGALSYLASPAAELARISSGGAEGTSDDGGGKPGDVP